ncbi:hras-like suppressor 3 [Plakobranchus ocellatus]|uniref:Hras-like suppressor 3 n=1 Tax=Plakobranchus ocellatus TaxID=259542 RepID=A0AAV4AUA5_9GAST|nr:hras-like suppressor 3 [Plakobranchus ocellatus]
MSSAVGLITGSNTTNLLEITEEADLDRVELGSLLMFQTDIQHYAVYVGERKMVYLTTHAGISDVLMGETDGEVSCVRIYVGHKDTNIFVDNSRDAYLKPYPPGTVVSRAMGKLGKAKYHLTKNNCEHFATWCRYGKGESRQVEKGKAASIVALGLSVGLRGSSFSSK